GVADTGARRAALGASSTALRASEAADPIRAMRETRRTATPVAAVHARRTASIAAAVPDARHEAARPARPTDLLARRAANPFRATREPRRAAAPVAAVHARRTAGITAAVLDAGDGTARLARPTDLLASKAANTIRAMRETRRTATPVAAFHTARAAHPVRA